MRLEVVNPAEWMPSIQDLTASNWTETGFDFPFKPDLQAYQRLFDAGICFAVAAIEADVVIGYCTVTVVPHLHNPAVLIGSNDALFVKAEFRKGTATARLMRVAEEEAARRGATRFTWHCRAGTDFARMLMRRGYRAADEVVIKEI